MIVPLEWFRSMVDGSPLRTVDAYDVRFPGFDGQPVAGWLMLPRGAAGRPGLGQGRGPEGPEVRRLGHLGPVGPQFLQRHVGQRHVQLRSVVPAGRA
jgi:hypothetical protein